MKKHGTYLGRKQEQGASCLFLLRQYVDMDFFHWLTAILDVRAQPSGDQIQGEHITVRRWIQEKNKISDTRIGVETTVSRSDESLPQGNGDQQLTCVCGPRTAG